MPHDEHLLERARTQWQFGDWGSLAALDSADFEHHPQRARLALFAAAGCQQLGRHDAARRFARLAHDWGCDRTLMARLLISGVYHTLGCATALGGQKARALRHIETSLAVGAPGHDVALLASARALHHFDSAGSLKLERGPVSASIPALVRCRAELDGQSLSLAFNPAVPDSCRAQDGALYFQLSPGKHGYLVSNETGNFNVAPGINQVPLAADKTYEISGHIACRDCAEPPIVWLFEYADGGKLNGSSIPTRGGDFKGYVRTQGAATSFALGIRLQGAGRLDVAATRIQITSGQVAALAESIDDKVTKRLSQIQTKLKTEQQRHHKSTLAQVENFIRLQSYMGADFLMPDLHGWPISPDLGVLLIRLVEANGYDAVIEFGSGVSTVILAKALSNGARSADKPAAILLSFEHLEDYFEQTGRILHQARLRDQVDLALAPLVPFGGPDAVEYAYYDCASALSGLRQRLNAGAPRILVLVDGPPAATGPQARYPALPLLLAAFGDQAHFDILMDDYIRADEREILTRWEALLAERGRVFSKQDYPTLEKQACLLRLEATPA